MAVITPYLFYSGRCDEALDYYRDRLGGVVETVMRFNDSPDPVPEGMLQAGFEAKVMHASMTIGGARLMLSDGCNDHNPPREGFSLALSVATEAEAHSHYNALADGGKATMPLMKTFWSPCYGQVTDRFGMEWMVMVQGPMPA